MFNYYPTPFPDEHLASVIYRAFLLTYYTNIETHFKYRLKQPFFEAPVGFWVPAYSSLVDFFNVCDSVERLIKRHSNVMDYTMWTPVTDYQTSLFERLESVSNLHWRLSVHIDTDRKWRYCPDCANEDFEQYGTAYWHATHQRYYQRTCPKHKTLLTTHNARKFTLPPIGEVAVKASIDEIKLDKCLANIISTLRQLSPQEGKKRVIYALKNKLNIADTMTRHSYNGRRLSLLHNMVADAINTPAILPFFTFDKAVSMHAPLNSMSGLYDMLNGNNLMHPMWYIILIHVFLSEEESLIAFDSTRDWEEARWDIDSKIMPIAA